MCRRWGQTFKKKEKKRGMSHFFVLRARQGSGQRFFPAVEELEWRYGKVTIRPSPRQTLPIFCCRFEDRLMSLSLTQTRPPFPASWCPSLKSCANRASDICHSWTAIPSSAIQNKQDRSVMTAKRIRDRGTIHVKNICAFCCLPWRNKPEQLKKKIRLNTHLNFSFFFLFFFYLSFLFNSYSFTVRVPLPECHGVL